MRAKIIAYNYNKADGFTDFSLNCFWGNNYQNVFYLCGDLGRSTFEDIIETETDLTGATERVQNTSIERYNLTVLATNPLLSFLKTIDKHDVKQIEFLDNGETYEIKNIDINDEGDRLTPNNLIIITFESKPISKVSENFYEITDKKFAYFDNNNDGTPDINGEAEYQAVTGTGFTTYQLYYEADGITPAVSGNVLLSVYAVTNTGNENLIGLFNGQFGDFLSDATKWQTTQNIYNYFFSLNTIGFGNILLFDKQGFAEDNGYLSDEQEDRAIEIIFKLSIDGSDEQQTTLKKVYTLRGAFHSSGVQDPITSVYGITTIGKNNTQEKNTLNTIADILQPVPSGTAQFISSATLVNVTTYSNEYQLNTAPANENIFSCNFSTKGGFEGSNFRGSYGADNFTFNIDNAAPIVHSLNVLNFTTGGSPFIFRFDWKYDRQSGGGGFPILGDITAAGAAEILLDGALVTNLPTITPATLQVLGTDQITLPDANKHEVKLYLPTTTGYEINAIFEVQLIPLF